MTSTIFKVPIDMFMCQSHRISINNNEFYVPDNIFKKYFVLAEVNNSRFDGVHDYEISVDSMLVDKSICMLIVAWVLSGFHDSQDSLPRYKILNRACAIFADKYLDVGKVINRSPRLKLIKEIINMKTWFIDSSAKNLSEIAYHRVGCAVLIELKKINTVFSKKQTCIWGYNNRYKQTNNPKYGSTIGIYDGGYYTLLLLEELQKNNVNIYNTICDCMNIYDEELILFGLDRDYFSVPPTYFVGTSSNVIS